MEYKVLHQVPLWHLLRFVPLLVALTLLLGCNSSSNAAVPTPTPLPTPLATPSLGQGRLDPSGIEQVWVPAGSFQMGTDEGTRQELEALNPPDWVRREFPSEQPQHEVRLTSGY
jgi:formylglycine-generating enzyme required for sulfatase activity